MEEKKKTKRFFEPEFKADAVKLVESSSRSVS
jgi:transposase-like protein